MRRGLPLVVALLVALSPGALAQLEEPLLNLSGTEAPLPSAPIDDGLAEPLDLPVEPLPSDAPLVSAAAGPEPSGSVTAPGVAEASVTLAGGVLPVLEAAVRLDLPPLDVPLLDVPLLDVPLLDLLPPLGAAPDAPAALPAAAVEEPSRSDPVAPVSREEPPLAPGPFWWGSAHGTPPAEEGARIERAAADPNAAAGPRGRGPPARDSPGHTALVAGPASPLDSSPVAAGVALGVTALLAVLARLYSRFEGSSVLRAEPRARIHAALSGRPGATLSDLAAETGMSRGALVHHCQMLERHGLVTSVHDGLNRRFFLAGPKVGVVARPPTPAERRVLDLLRERGPLTQAEVAALLGVTPQAVSYHLLRLRRDARVEVRADGGQRRWEAAGEGATP